MKFLSSVVQKLSSEQTYRQTDRQIDRQINRQTDEQTGTQTDKQTERLDWNYYLPHTRMVIMSNIMLKSASCARENSFLAHETDSDMVLDITVFHDLSP